MLRGVLGEWGVNLWKLRSHILSLVHEGAYHIDLQQAGFSSVSQLRVRGKVGHRWAPLPLPQLRPAEQDSESSQLPQKHIESQLQTLPNRQL